MNNVVICGIGLIGGSIAKGLSKDNFNVYVMGIGGRKFIFTYWPLV